MKTVRFGIIGCGLMGREFASAAARWCHLLEIDVRPEIVAVCDTNPALFPWYTEHFPSIRQATQDYRELLANAEVEAVYCAVPHHLHREIYCAAIAAGKHLMGEKPFGIDRPANDADPGLPRRASRRVRALLVGVPLLSRRAADRAMIERGAFGRIIEVNAGFLHSSDLDPQKPMNWKRMVQFNGEYGCMGDLGMHVCHVPFRAGWIPRTVRAVLSNIVPQRPDGRGGMAPCETWDNATLLCDAADPATGDVFPMTLKTQRIAPGEKDTWYLRGAGHAGLGPILHEEPQAAGTARLHRRRADLGPDRHGLRNGLQDHHRRDLRVRLLRRDFADVGRLPLRIGARPAGCPVCRLRHAGGDGVEPSAVHRGVGVAAQGGGDRRVRAGGNTDSH